MSARARLGASIAAGVVVVVLASSVQAAPPDENPGRGNGGGSSSETRAPNNPGGNGQGSGNAGGGSSNSGGSSNPGNSGNAGGSGGSSNPGNSGNAGGSSNAGGGGNGSNSADNPAANPQTNADSRPASTPARTPGPPDDVPAADRRAVPTANLPAAARSALQRALDVDLEDSSEEEQARQLALRSCLADAAEAQNRRNVRREERGKPVKAEDKPENWKQGRLRKLERECEDEVGERGDYIVVFTPGAAASEQAQEAREKSAKRPENRLEVKKTFTNIFPGALINAGDKQIEALKKNPNVQVVEPDGLAQAIASQDPAPWGLDRSDQRLLPLDGSFSYDATGAGVDAYIVDTGIRADHQDFAGRVTGGYTAIDDGNGTSDCNGHGTHVAGTVAGGVYGAAKAATLIPVRVLDCSGAGTWSGVISGLDFIAGQHAPGTPAVANMSLGGGANSSVDLAVRNLSADGVTVVVAAGNSASDACTTSPAREPSAVTVAATDAGDNQAYFSNYGQCVDIYAPGVGVTSAWYTSPTATASLSGTSMAAPHVAGAAALLLQTNPNASPDSVWGTLRQNATSGVLSNVGSGSPDRLLYMATVPEAPSDEPTDPQEPSDPQDPVATVPEAPSAVTATPGVRSATVTWARPADGGSAITSQYVYVYDERGRLRATIQVAGDATSVAVDQLRPRKPYTFRVSAMNLVGQGELSQASAPVTATNR